MVWADFQRGGVNWMLRHDPLHHSQLAQQLPTTSLYHHPRHGARLKHPPCHLIGSKQNVWHVLSQVIDFHSHVVVRSRTNETKTCRTVDLTHASLHAW